LCFHFNHSSVVFVSFFTSLFHFFLSPFFSSSFFMFLSFGVILLFWYNLFYFLPPLSVSMFVGMLGLFFFIIYSYACDCALPMSVTFTSNYKYFMNLK
jgi:hypothetical protein